MSYDQITKWFVENFLQPATLIAFAGMVVSVFTTYWPGFREWYAALDSTKKAFGQLIIIWSGVLLAGVLTWTKIIIIVPSGIEGVVVLFAAGFLATLSNQATYMLTTPPASVAAIKAEKLRVQLVDAKITVKADESKVSEKEDEPITPIK